MTNVLGTFLPVTRELYVGVCRPVVGGGGKQSRILSLHPADNPQKLQFVLQGPEEKFVRT